MIPYIIQIAHPDYKRPYVDTIYGSENDLEKVKSNILQRLLDYIREFIDEDNESSSNPFEDVYDNYYSEYFMYNEPWQASAFIDGKWTNCTSTFEEIYNKYKEEKAKEESEEEGDS